MQYKLLGKSDLNISLIGMGCWAIGGTKWGLVDDSQSLKAIKKAVEKGVNFFDTADFYGLGHSEELLGKALGFEKNIVIATKVGLRWNNKGKICHDLSAGYVKKACNDSLKRLRRDAIDLYQIHWPDPDTDFTQTLKALDDLVLDGRVRYIGACNLNLEQLKQISVYPWFVSYQGIFNLFRQKVKAEILPFCAKKNIGFIGYEPLFKGMLTGKFKDLPKFEKGDHRKYKGRFTRNFGFYKSKVDFLSGIAARHGLKITQLALALLLKEEGVSTVIPGAKTDKQVAENVSALNIDDKLLEVIEREVKEVLIDV